MSAAHIIVWELVRYRGSINLATIIVSYAATASHLLLPH